MEVRVSGFRDGLRDEARRMVTDAVADVAAGYALLPAQTREALDSDLSTASAVLAERGIEHAAPATPGEAVVRRELTTVALGIGVRDLER